MGVTRAPIAVALDAPDLPTLSAWAQAVGPHVSTLKVGLETYLRDGRAAVAAARDSAPECHLFLDLKLHDIPATVAGAAGAVADLAPDYLTVHASGGRAMIAAAAEALPHTRVVAVDAGARAIVCSPQEVADVRAALSGRDVVLITPGVRPAGADAGDQRRVATPRQALDRGADLLVIGRPITGATDPAAAAAAIARELVDG
ncbi:MAG: orotidine 5'-phosphate decarboxylase / HUMPS family protein [Candidatus Nanopelagicales bacterium]